MSIKYSIRLDSDILRFSAFHAIRYESGELEEPHRHDFRIRAIITGPLNGASYVIDFVQAEQILLEIISQFEGRTLLAENDPISENGTRISCDNCTAEMIASCILTEFRKKLREKKLFVHDESEYELGIELEETPGAWAICCE